MSAVIRIIKGKELGSASSSGSVYRSDHLIAPSGSGFEEARICEDGSLQVGGLMLPILRELAQYAIVRESSDNYIGHPITRFTITRIAELLAKVFCKFYRSVNDALCPYDVAPLGNGGAQLEWRGPGGTLELEVHANGSYGYLLIQGEGQDRRFEEDDDISEDKVLSLLSQVLCPDQER